LRTLTQATLLACGNRDAEPGIRTLLDSSTISILCGVESDVFPHYE